MNMEETHDQIKAPTSRWVALAFASKGCIAAAMVYWDRFDATEPGGGGLKGLFWFLLWLTVGVAAVVLATVASAWTLYRSRSERRVALDVAIPASAALVLVVALIVPVGYTLMRAVHSDNVGAARRTLLFGVSPNTHENWGWHNLRGDSALQVAAKHGNVRMVRLLLEHGATIEPAAIEDAADAGHRDVVTLLLDRGAEIDAQDDE
jgi:hypothetical protein